MTNLENFAESPFRPLSDHMAKVKECVALVVPMFEEALTREWDALADRAQKIFKVEHEADKIKTEIRRAMPRTFALPIYRGDLLAYLKLQDDMADTVEDLAVVLTLKNLSLPAELVEDVRGYVAKVVEVCGFLFQCTDQLTDLKESDFSGNVGRGIMELVAKAEHAEWESDKAEYEVSKKLFAHDHEIGPSDIYLWSKVFMELGKLANHADKTAERLRQMLLR